MQLMRNPEAAKMRVRFYKVRPMAPFLDVNVQDSRLRHRKRVVFAARDVLLLTVELCKVELCPMLVPFVGRRLFFYRVAILHCPFFSGGVPWCVELVADRWWRRLCCRTELEVNATRELKTAVDTNGCRTVASVEVKSFVGSKSCVEVLERLRNFSLHVGCLRKSKKF